MLSRCSFVPSSSARLVCRSLAPSQFHSSHYFSTQAEPAVAPTPAPAPTAVQGGATRHNSAKLSKEEHFRVEEDQHVFDAIDILRKKKWTKMDETLDISVNLGVDPRKPNQSIKGVAKLTHGTGKKVRVCVFASGSDAAAATAAGADIVGGLDLVEKIMAGELNFDTVIAHPSLMGAVGKVGRIIGPKGMMPSPKMGTVTVNVAEAVKIAKAGAVKFKVEKAGIVHAGIGKMSFSNEMLMDNIRSFMIAVQDCKPEAIKGKYLKRVHLSCTMGPSIPLQLHSVDPSGARFMLRL